MTVSADVKLMPRPPALVLRREDEDLGSRLEVVDRVSSVFEFRGSVKAEVLVVAVGEIFFHEIDHSSHLKVEQDTMAAFLELEEQLV